MGHRVQMAILSIFHGLCSDAVHLDDAAWNDRMIDELEGSSLGLIEVGC
jgi:hypothetical protein